MMTRTVRAVLLAVFAVMFLPVFSLQAEDRIKLIAGFGNPHPPLLINKDRRIGLLFDTIHLMNRYSDKYVIEMMTVPPKRIYSEYEKMGLDLVPYSNVNWGWKQRGGLASIPLIQGKDVFFSRRQPASQQPASQQPPLDSIGAVLGFHYAFAGFSHENLSAMPNVTLVQNEERVVQQVLRGRVERGVASETYLGWLSVSSPQERSQLIIHPEADHDYERHFVRLPGANISVGDLNAIFAAPGFWDELHSIFTGYGLNLRDKYSD